MNADLLNGFFLKLAESPELRREFVEMAARHGFDFSAGEMSDDQLDEVAGGTLDGAIKDAEASLASIGSDGDLSNIDLQSQLQKQQQSLQTMSNVSKMLHDTAMSVTRKIG